MSQAEDRSNKQRQTGELGDSLYQFAKFIASLKFTVVLFALAIILILAGTLAQVSMDLSAVLKQYFRCWIAHIELQVFFPPSFFSRQPEVPGVLWFPGGKLIGSLGKDEKFLCAGGVRRPSSRRAITGSIG